MKKLSNSLKLLVALGTMLLALLIFNTNDVQAGTIVSGTPTANSLDDISNVFTLDMKTTSFDKIEETIYKQVVASLKAKGIDVRDNDDGNIILGVTVEFPIEENQHYIEKGRVYIWNQDKQDVITDKDFTINWTNKTPYSEADQKYIDGLVKTFPENICKYDELGKDLGSRVDYAIETLEKLVNDDTITFVANGGGSGGAGSLTLSGGGKIGISIAKNGVFYSNVALISGFQYYITIPSNIENTDTAYINYALPKIKSYLKDSPYVDTSKLNMEKISGGIYKVYSSDDKNNYDTIILKKLEGTHIGNNIFVSSLDTKITVTVKANNTMEQKAKEKGYNKVLGSYELKLEGTTKLANAIDVTFNVGTEHNNKQVYILHQKQDGSYENFEKNVAGGKVTVTVSELSPFVLALKENITPSTQEPEQPKQDEPETTKQDDKKPDTTTNKPHIKDETPKTGSDNIVVILSSVLSILSIAGIAIIKKF